MTPSGILPASSVTKATSRFSRASVSRDAKFFPNARLNYAENLLRGADDRLAIIAHGNSGIRRHLTRRELRDKVSQAMQALSAEGVGKGDRVAAIITNDTRGGDPLSCHRQARRHLGLLLARFRSGRRHRPASARLSRNC